MTLEVTILGCGSSGGVPRGDGDWGACDPAEPRNRRTRCSALIRRHGPDGATTALIDTSPDLRQQMLAAGVKAVDAVPIRRGVRQESGDRRIFQILLSPFFCR